MLRDPYEAICVACKKSKVNLKYLHLFKGSINLIVLVEGKVIAFDLQWYEIQNLKERTIMKTCKRTAAKIECYYLQG